MASNLSIECADRSVRWYLTPGQASRYEIIVINKSGDEHVDCTLTLDEPSEGGTFEPASFTLRPRERKTVALTFSEDTQVPRDQMAMISVRDPNGDVIASLERGLISAGGTDCTVQLAFKEPILDGDQVRGFVVACTIKSLSATAGQFALQFTPHPSLEFVDASPVKLEPGQTQTVPVAILWNRAVKDSLGNNHPHVVEIGVAVSQGKRSGRLAWDTVEHRLAAYAPARQAPAPPAQPQQFALAQEVLPPAEPDAQVAMPFFEAPTVAPQAPQPTTAAPPVVPATAMPPPTMPPSTPPASAPTQIPPPPWSAPPTIAANSAAPTQPSPPQPPPPPDTQTLGNDDELMSLLVGRPVSPPAGWRGPGRDAPDAPTEPPSIFARTPSSVMNPQAQVPPAPPVAPPVSPVTPPPPWSTPEPTRAAAPPPPPPPVRRPPPVPEVDDGVPKPYRQVFTPPGTVTEDQEPPPELTQDEGIFGESPLESAIVGRAPTSRAADTAREQRATARRTLPPPEPPQEGRGGQLTTLVVGGTAVIAVGLMVFFYLRSTSSPQPQPQAIATATAVATVPPAVVLQTPAPATNRPKNAQSPAPGASGVPSAAPSVAATVAAQATQRVVATTAPTPRPAPTQAHVAIAPKPAKPKPRPTRRPAPANPNTIVSMQGVDAHYGPGGHAVRVLWGANGQASATVELMDDHGGVLSQTDVPGIRQSAVLYVPRTYRGVVTVQVVSVGASGERVTQSMSLPAFSH